MLAQNRAKPPPKTRTRSLTFHFEPSGSFTWGPTLPTSSPRWLSFSFSAGPLSEIREYSTLRLLGRPAAGRIVGGQTCGKIRWGLDEALRGSGEEYEEGEDEVRIG